MNPAYWQRDFSVCVASDGVTPYWPRDGTFDFLPPIVENETMPTKPVINIKTLEVMALLYHQMDRRHYGLSLSRELNMGNGTLYPILDKLEKLGLITGEFEDIDPVKEGRRPRRYYCLTGEGISVFEMERSRIFSGIAVKI